MVDRPFLILSDRWRLSCDPLQVIVERWRAPRWRQVAFVMRSKAALMRVLTENGAEVSELAKAALDRLPDDLAAVRADPDPYGNVGTRSTLRAAE